LCRKEKVCYKGLLFGRYEWNAVNQAFARWTIELRGDRPSIKKTQQRKLNKENWDFWATPFVGGK
jgi:hypothetical protein